jgi:hypothetical protein
MKFGARCLPLLPSISQLTSKATSNALRHPARWRWWEDVRALFRAQEGWPSCCLQASAGRGQVAARCSGGTMDVGFNKPLKDWVQRQWMHWMMAKGVIHGTTSPPLRVDVAKWVDAAMAEMKGAGDIIRNAWKRNWFEWFVNDAGEQAVGEDAGCRHNAREQAVDGDARFLDNTLGTSCGWQC